MKYGYRDITDVCLLDLVTGNPVIYLDYLQTASQNYTNEIVYQKGARGAPKLVGFQSDNGLRLEMTSALLSPELLAIMFGTTATTGSANVPVTQIITATGNTFNLAATPVIGTTTPITVSPTLDGSVPTSSLTKVASATPTTSEFSVTGLTVTVNSTTYASGSKFIVTYYKASTASNKRVKFQSDKFTKAYKLTGYTLFKNSDNDAYYPCRVEIPKIQLEINGLTLNSAMSGDPTNLQFAGECLKTSTSNDLIVFDIDEGEVITN